MIKITLFAYCSQYFMEDAVTLAVDRYLETAHRELKVFVDMSKDFDKVKHQVTWFFLMIFFDVGMSVVVLDCFVSYPSRCMRRLVIKYDEISPYVACESEAPQDSVLGPLLFSFYGTVVNMAIDAAQSPMFADDTLLDAAGQSANEISLTLSSVLSNLAWHLLHCFTILSYYVKLLYCLTIVSHSCENRRSRPSFEQLCLNLIFLQS